MTQTIKSAWSNVAGATTPGTAGPPVVLGRRILVALSSFSDQGGSPFQLALTPGGSCHPLNLQPASSYTDVAGYCRVKRPGWGKWRVRSLVVAKTTGKPAGWSGLYPPLSDAVVTTPLSGDIVDGRFLGLPDTLTYYGVTFGGGTVETYAEAHFLEASPDGVTWPDLPADPWNMTLDDVAFAWRVCDPGENEPNPCA
jgi:hypothetical protein